MADEPLNPREQADKIVYEYYEGIREKSRKLQEAVDSARKALARFEREAAKRKAEEAARAAKKRSLFRRLGSR